MIKLSSDIPFDIFDAISEQVQKAPALVKRGLPRVTRPIDKRMLGELTNEPPKWTGKRRWKSEKQRRFVMAKLTRENNLPYQRSHQLSEAWRVVTIFDTDGVTIFSENDTPSARYVQGDDAQPMHLDSGWPQAAPIFTKYLPIYEDALIDFWFLISDPLAGIPK